MSVVVRELGNLSKALELTLQALAIARTNGFRWEEARCLVRLGNLYVLQKDFPRAQGYFHQAMRVQAAIGAAEDLMTSQMLLGGAFEQQNALDSALYYEQIAYQQVNRPAYKEHKPEVLRVLGNIYAKRNQPNRAMHYYRQALQVGTQNNDLRINSAICIHIARLYRDLNQTDSCLHYARRGLAYAQLTKNRL
jgi:tetratricopeptide (TPR) repeat protein